MNTQMPVGYDNFRKVREGFYFVDKINIIRELLDSHFEVTLITHQAALEKR